MFARQWPCSPFADSLWRLSSPAPFADALRRRPSLALDRPPPTPSANALGRRPSHPPAGVLLEDLEVPGAVLCPKMDDAGVLKTVSHMARHHAQFWNMPELSSGALGIKPHNASWCAPATRSQLARRPRTIALWLGLACLTV
jgi:hypothetical protein